jgi:hypothetical protein
MSRNVHRGMIALALTAALALASAAPAAAGGLQFEGNAWQPAWAWLSGLWTGFFGSPEGDAASERPQSTREKYTFGLDPNGDPHLEDPNDDELSAMDAGPASESL